MMHIADNQDALLDYLYEEGDSVERLNIARHLQECASCSVAVLELQTVRGMLRDWAPPASQLGFRIVQDGDASPAASVDDGARRGWLWGRGPATHQATTSHRRWAQVAAAVALFGAGMTVSQLDLDYGDGALTVRTRPAASAPPAIRNASVVLPPDSSVGSGSSRTATDNRTAAGQGAPSGSRDDLASTERLLQRVRAMIEQSEIRQQREMALRLSQVAREVDTQHQADLLRIQQNLGQFELETGAQINQQQQLMDYLVRTSGEVK